MKAKRIIVHGLVQGVFYRSHCVKKAKQLDCKGYVRNLPDGTVEVIISGEKTKKLIEWCKNGPDEAQVDSLDIKDIEIEEEFSSFERKN